MLLGRACVQSDGRGWARNVVNRLCIDPTGKVSEPCTRDNVKESYLTPTEHPVTVRLTGAVPVGATCAWSFDDGEGPARTSTLDCAEPINLRVRYGGPTNVTIDVTSADGPQRVTGAIGRWLGEGNIVAKKPVMGAEDFGLFGRTEPRIPICMFWLGTITKESVTESIKTGKTLPSLHSSKFAPVPEPTLKTGVTAMSAAVLELVGKK